MIRRKPSGFTGIRQRLDERWEAVVNDRVLFVHWSKEKVATWFHAFRTPPVPASPEDALQRAIRVIGHG